MSEQSAGFTFSTTKTIVCEPGCLAQLGTLCERLAVTNLMVVTDQGIVAAGLLEKLKVVLNQSALSFVIYDQVVADPPEAIVLEALSQAKSAKIDGVIGYGGGSSMDVAKLVALLVHSEQSLPDVYGVENARGNRLPLLQIPTTAGTGSEVTPIAIITTGETTKQGVVAPQLLPDIALLDADLTLGLPPHVTAATGIDAMVHAIEAYTSKHKKNPYSDMLAKEALRLLSSYIEVAVKQGDDREARSNMLLGAMLAGQAFANAPVAAVHALAYPLGGHFHISHGLSNSLVLPHVLRFNLDVAEKEYAELAPTIGVECQGSTAKNAAAFITRMNGFIQAVGLPQTLSELDIPESALTMLAEQGMLQQRLLVNNPREVTLADALAIYQAAF